MQDLSPNAKKLVGMLAVGAIGYALYRVAKGDSAPQAVEKTVRIPIKVADTVIEVVKDAGDTLATPVKKTATEVKDAVIKKERKAPSEKQLAARKRFAEMNKGRKGAIPRKNITPNQSGSDTNDMVRGLRNNREKVASGPWVAHKHGKILKKFSGYAAAQRWMKKNGGNDIYIEAEGFSYGLTNDRPKTYGGMTMEERSAKGNAAIQERQKKAKENRLENHRMMPLDEDGAFDVTL